MKLDLSLSGGNFFVGDTLPLEEVLDALRDFAFAGEISDPRMIAQTTVSSDLDEIWASSHYLKPTILIFLVIQRRSTR